VLSRRKFDRYVTPADRQQFLRLLGGIVRMVSITQTLAVCPTLPTTNSSTSP